MARNLNFGSDEFYLLCVITGHCEQEQKANCRHTPCYNPSQIKRKTEQGIGPEANRRGDKRGYTEVHGGTRGNTGEHGDRRLAKIHQAFSGKRK